MIGIRRFLIPAVVALALQSGCVLHWRHEIKVGLRTPQQAHGARLDVSDKVPILHLYGTPAEMGRQYGLLLKVPLQALIHYADALLPANTKKNILAYAADHEKYLPSEIRDQLKATSIAAEVPYDYLVALNVVPKLACTTIAAWGNATANGEMIMGRNADYFGLGLADRGSMVVVYHRPDGHSVVCVTFLGMAGAFAGINDAGVCFGNMLVFNSSDGGDRSGLPIQLQMRLAAEQAGDVGQMQRQLCIRRHVIPMNVMIADASDARVLEIANRDIAVIRGRDTLISSNHFIENTTRSHEVSCPRYDALTVAVEKDYGRLTPELIAKALYDARMPNLNLQAVIFEPKAMRMHVSINKSPAAAGPYRVFDVRKLLAIRP